MNDKEKFDSISVLYKQSCGNYNERRKYEDKYSISIYSIFAISIAGVLLYLKGDALNYCILLWGTIILGGLLLTLHIIWLNGANKANFIDRKIAFYYEKIMQDLTNSNFTDEFKKNILRKILCTRRKFLRYLKTGVI